MSIIIKKICSNAEFFPITELSLFWCSKEDEIVTKANSSMQTLIGKIHSDEIQRNRSRVSEINTLIDHYKEELDNIEPGAM